MNIGKLLGQQKNLPQLMRIHKILLRLLIKLKYLSSPSLGFFLFFREVILKDLFDQILYLKLFSFLGFYFLDMSYSDSLVVLVAQLACFA
jgi:hypothetical protein